MHTIQAVIDWIFNPPTKKEYLRLPFIILAIDVVYNMVAITAMLALDIGADVIEDPYEIPIVSWEFPITLLFVSVVEELLFRIIPLIILIRYVNNRTVTLVSMVILSMLFGYMHYGWESVLVQGIGGIWYTVLFIKYAEHGTRFLQASLVVILVHTIFNAFIALTVALSGGTTL